VWIRRRHHSFDCRHQQVMRVERIGMIHSNLIENLAEELKVLGDRSLSGWGAQRILC
jgi:hypothetical protein